MALSPGGLQALLGLQARLRRAASDLAEMRATFDRARALEQRHAVAHASQAPVASELLQLVFCLFLIFL